MADVTTPCTIGRGQFERNEVKLGRGSAQGYIKIVLWATNAAEAKIAQDVERRKIALTKRVAALVGADPECQRILEEERAARPRFAR